MEKNNIHLHIAELVLQSQSIHTTKSWAAVVS